MNGGLLCISICTNTVNEMIGSIERASEYADLIELRFDRLDPSTVSKFSDLKFEMPVIATFRSGSIDARLDFWKDTASAFSMCDLEEDILTSVDCQRKIASFHDHNGVPAELPEIYERLAASDADILKVAVTAHDITDAIPVWKLLERAKASGRKIIPIAMGEAGKWTRILGNAHGAFLTYASLDTGKETADGQLTARDLVDVYRVKQLDRETRVHGVIGDPVSQSMSPYMHNAAFATTGENAVFMHLLVKDLDAFMARMVKPATREVELNFAGLSVTMPHKQAIMRHLDSIDPTAAAIGAVNTLKIDCDGRMTGYNTDGHGFITPLKARRGDLAGSRVAVVGAGGAARAVVHALKQDNAEVIVFGRDPRKMEWFAAELSVAVKPISDLRSEISNFDILVNATPVGMKGALRDESLFTADELSGVEFVYDLVTRADGTPLQKAAAQAGIPCIGGLEMLIAQGARQFEIWTGREAPRQLMKDALVQRMGG